MTPLQILLEPGQSIHPGLRCLGFNVALAGIIVKGVIDTWIDFHLKGLRPGRRWNATSP
jgi:hypothetical protein